MSESHPPSRPKRDKRRDWELQPGDLPPARVREREPLLRDLEHNPVFRLMTMRSRPFLGRNHDYGIPYVCLFLFLTGLGQWFPPDARHVFHRYAIPFLAAGFPFCWIGRGVFLGGFGFLVGRRAHRDLYLSGFPAKEMAAAVWGSLLRERHLPSPGAYGAAALVVVLGAVIDPWGGGGQPLLYIPAFWVGAAWAVSRRLPEATLHVCASALAARAGHSPDPPFDSESPVLQPTPPRELFGTALDGLIVVAKCGLPAIPGLALLWILRGFDIDASDRGPLPWSHPLALLGCALAGRFYGSRLAREGARYKAVELRRMRAAVSSVCAAAVADSKPSLRIRDFGPIPSVAWTSPVWAALLCGSSRRRLGALAAIEIAPVLALLVPFLAFPEVPMNLPGLHMADWSDRMYGAHAHWFHLRDSLMERNFPALGLVAALLCVPRLTRRPTVALALAAAFAIGPLAAYELHNLLVVELPNRPEFFARRFGYRHWAPQFEPAWRRMYEWLIPALCGLFAWRRTGRYARFAAGYLLGACLVYPLFHARIPGVEPPDAPGPGIVFYTFGAPGPLYYAVPCAIGFLAASLAPAMPGQRRALARLFRFPREGPKDATRARRAARVAVRAGATLALVLPVPYFVAFGVFERRAMDHWLRDLGAWEARPLSEANFHTRMLADRKNLRPSIVRYEVGSSLSVAATERLVEIATPEILDPWCYTEAVTPTVLAREGFAVAGDDDLTRFFERISPLLARLENASRADYAYWTFVESARSEVFTTLRACMRFLGMRALRRMCEGDDAGAIEDIDTMYRTTRLHVESPQVLLQMIGVAISRMANSTLTSYAFHRAGDASALRAALDLLDRHESIPETLRDPDRLPGYWPATWPISTPYPWPGDPVGGDTRSIGQILQRLCLFDRTRLEILLELHRAERGAYPESLDALVPDFIAELPRNPFDGSAYRYVAPREGAQRAPAICLASGRYPSGSKQYEDDFGPGAFANPWLAAALAKGARAERRSATETLIRAISPPAGMLEMRRSFPRPEG